jgi:hypothetical protein
MGLRSRYSRGMRIGSEVGIVRPSCSWGRARGFPVPLPACCSGVAEAVEGRQPWKWGRTEPIWVERGGPGGFRGRGRIVATTIIAWRAHSPSSPSRRKGRRSPFGRWGLTAQRGPSKGAYHAINTEMRLGLPGQSNALVIK